MVTLDVEPGGWSRCSNPDVTIAKYSNGVRPVRGICPVAERMWEKELMVTNVCRAGLSQQDLMDVVLAFEKVAGNVAELG